MADYITLRRAVVEQALEALEWAYDLNSTAQNYRPLQDSIAALRLRAALAEPVQEPVAWAFRYGDGTYHDPSLTEHSAGMVPLYTTPPDHTAEIERAVAAEREACALVCENELVDAEATNDESDRAYNSALGHAADAIRARGKK